MSKPMNQQQIRQQPSNRPPVNRKCRRRERGYINSVECLFLLTSMMCCSVIMAGTLGSKIIAEAADIGSAISSLNQSFTMTGVAVGHPNDPNHPTDVASWAGASFVDSLDFCDQSATCGVRLCINATLEAP